MPTFDFTGGAGTLTSASNFSLTYDDTSSGSPVTFSLSTSSNPNGGYSSGFSNIGQISITDTVPGGAYILDVDAGGTLTNFGGSGGSITLDLGTYVSGTWNITFVHETTTTKNVTFTVDNTTDVVSFVADGNYQDILFTSTVSGAGAITVDSLTATIVCYLEGTGIATPTGRVEVQYLKSGDLITTADGGTTRVNWMGIQPVDVRKATPAKVNPVCIMADAIAPGVPSRDLFVSPDHAIEIDGVLYNARALVNHTSIYQRAQMPLEGFTYYHIDTGTHQLILAEDCSSETYLDAVGRDTFVNGAEMEDAPIIVEMALPRIAAKRMVPQDVKEALAERAEMLGLTKSARAA